MCKSFSCVNSEVVCVYVCVCACVYACMCGVHLEWSSSPIDGAGSRGDV